MYGVGIGGIATIFASLAGDLFEGPSLGVIMGFLEISFALGGTVGPVFAGFAFDITGSYLLPFAAVGGAMLIAILSCSRLQRFMKESFAAKTL
jgi:MFS family permease